MSRTGNWVIAGQERLSGMYGEALVERWMNDSYNLHVAMLALKRIASGENLAGAIASAAIEQIDPTYFDPEATPGHQYATDREARQHFIETTLARAD